MARLADRVTLEQRADWLVLATRLVLLRSRLLFPDSPESAAEAEQDAAAELRASMTWRRCRRLGLAPAAAAAWPGCFRPAATRAARGRLCRADGSVPGDTAGQGRASGRGAALSAGHSESLARGGCLGADPDAARRISGGRRPRRLFAAGCRGGCGPPASGAGSGGEYPFLAGLELAREGILTLAQDVPFRELQLAGAPSSLGGRSCCFSGGRVVTDRPSAAVWLDARISQGFANEKDGHPLIRDRTPSAQSQTHSAADALLLSIDLAVAAKE